MGRVSEFFDYINIDTPPTGDDLKARYGSLDISDEVKQARKSYRKNLRDRHKALKEAVESFLSCVPVPCQGYYLPGFTEALNNLKTLIDEH